MTRSVAASSRGIQGEALRTSALLTLALALTGLGFFSERPLWGDEVLQFAFGAYDSTGEAWHNFRLSVGGINCGQTGAYIMLNYWSLALFGASRLAMRWPSLLAGVVLAVAAVRLLALWGLPWRWRVFAVLGIFGQWCLMTLLPNARYYMPLVAGVMAVGAFYYTPTHDRGFGTYVLGVAGMLLGGLFHPYFPVYAAGLCLLAYHWHLSSRRVTLRWSAGWQHSAPPVWMTGALAWWGIGRVSWMRGTPNWELDPWEMIGTGWTAVRTFITTHFYFLTGPVMWVAGAVLLVGLAMKFGFGHHPRHRRVSPVVATARVDARCALLWLGFAVAASLFLAFVSWWNSYPIFHRQWSVSVAMMPLGLAWLLAALTRTWKPRAAAAVAVVALGIVGWRTGGQAVAWWRAVPAPANHVSPIVRPADMKGWVELANRNCEQGGPVYPIFRTFYRF